MIEQVKKAAAAERSSKSRQREKAGQGTISLSVPESRQSDDSNGSSGDAPRSDASRTVSAHAGTVTTEAVQDMAKAASAGDTTGDTTPNTKTPMAEMPTEKTSTEETPTEEPPIDAASFKDSTIEALPNEVPVTVQLRLSPLQYARFETLLEKARTLGHRESREELVLAAFEALVALETRRARQRTRTGRERNAGSMDDPDLSESAAARNHPQGEHAPYQVVLYQCETCKRAHVPTSQGDKTIDMATLEEVLCDAVVASPGKRKRSTIPPSVRRKVLERDGYRCTVAGCGSTHFLRIHHQIPVSAGGTNDIENLRTTCFECHKWIHRNDWNKKRYDCTRVPKRATGRRQGVGDHKPAAAAG